MQKKCDFFWSIQKKAVLLSPISRINDFVALQFARGGIAQLVRAHDS